MIFVSINIDNLDDQADEQPDNQQLDDVSQLARITELADMVPPLLRHMANDYDRIRFKYFTSNGACRQAISDNLIRLIVTLDELLFGTNRTCEEAIAFWHQCAREAAEEAGAIIQESDHSG